MTDPLTKARLRPVIRVFVSSTFSDMRHERNALQEHVYPKLEQLCLRSGFQFQAIDLRWGVSSEAGLDHRTMRICFDELRRAQEISPRPNFLILLGNRYGWRPLPEEISAMEYEELKRGITKDVTDNTNEEHIREIRAIRDQTPDPIAVLGAWYRRDDNAVPPVYVLQSRRQHLVDGKDYTQDAVWNEVQAVLWEIINCAMPPARLQGRFNEAVRADGALPLIVRFQASATEQEIWQGALRVPDAKEHVLAFFREIADIDAVKEPSKIKNFVDVLPSGRLDAGLWEEQERLKAHLRGRLGQANVFEGRAAMRLSASESEGESTADVTTDHLGKLCTDVETRLAQIIQAQIDEYWQQSKPSSVERALRDLQIEQEEHARVSQERGGAETFVGREVELAAIHDYLLNDSTSPLVVHGASGCGKTALLSRAVQEAASLKPLVRLIGTHPRCSDLRGLLSSLCQELRLWHPREGELPTDIKLLEVELQEQFKAATPEQPLILFLDALDQLADTDGGRLLHWIPVGPLPAHVKLVVSCLSDRADGDSAGQPYAELTRRQLPATQFINLDAFSEDEARTLLFDRWLPQAGRTVSRDQRVRIEQRLASAACRQPIYLKLLFEEARLWRPYDATPDLGVDVPALLKQLFDRLSLKTNHGQLLVERVLGYLAASREGLAENEILEILYTDPKYKAALKRATRKNQHEMPPNAIRIPIAIWSRLRFDLASYLTERAATGANVLIFYHRQVVEWVQQRFAKASNQRWQPHALLADYFRDHADPKKNQSWKCDSPRPFLQVAFHLAGAQRVDELCQILCDLRFVEARCRAGQVFELIADYRLAKESLPEAQADLREERTHEERARRWTDEVIAYAGFLRKHTQRLTKYRGLLFTLIHREGFPSAKAQADDLVRRGLWDRVWINITPMWMPSGSETGAAALRVEVLSEWEFDISCATELAPDRLLAFMLQRIGRIEMVDVGSGRRLSVAVSTRTLRPVRLCCSSTGEYLSVAYDNGEIDVLRLRFASNGDFLSQQELGTLRYLVPEMELPVLEFVGTTLWFQAANNSVMAVDAAADRLSPREISGAAGSDIGELSGLVCAGKFVVLSLRCRGDTSLLTIDSAGRTSSATIPDTDITCLGGMPTGKVIVACTDRRLIVYGASDGLKYICETVVGELPACMASLVDALIVVSQIGTLHYWQVGDSIGLSDLESGGRLLLGARRLAHRTDGTLAAVTSASAMCFRTVRAVRRSNHLQAVFIRPNRTCFAVDKRPSGLFLLDIANEFEIFLESPHDWRHTNTFCMDDQGRLVGARHVGQGFLFDEGTLTPHLIQDIPPWITEISADPRGGFWLTDQWGAIYYLNQHDVCRKVEQVKFDGIGRSQILCCPGLLIWSGRCLFQTPEGHASLDVLVFFQLEERCLGKTELINYRVFDAEDGLLMAVSYDTVRRSILIFFQNGSRHKHCAKVGSVEDFLHRRERNVEITDVDLDVKAAVVNPDGKGVYLLCEGGNLFCLHTETFEVEAVLSGSLPITGISQRTAGDGAIALIEGGSKLMLCTLEGTTNELR